MNLRQHLQALRSALASALVASALVLLALACFSLAIQAGAQRQRPGKVTSLQATTDKEGSHPFSTEITEAKNITCLNAVSETPNTKPACRIVAPGFSGILAIGKSVNATGAGTVTLTCSGQGFMRCNARVSDMK
jgi:hypothetical protein